MSGTRVSNRWCYTAKHVSKCFVLVRCSNCWENNIRTVKSSTLQSVWFHNCDAHTPIPGRWFIQVSTSGFQTDNCFIFDWMIKRKQCRPLRYQQIGMYDVWGYGVVYSGKFIDDYEYKNNPWIQHGLHNIIGRMINECMCGVFHCKVRVHNK